MWLHNFINIYILALTENEAHRQPEQQDDKNISINYQYILQNQEILAWLYQQIFSSNEITIWIFHAVVLPIYMS